MYSVSNLRYIFIFLTIYFHLCLGQDCETEKATLVNGKPVCDREIIFEDDFDTINSSKWQHEVRFAHDGRFEFVMYDNRSDNSYIKDGVLYIKPTLLEDVYGESFIRTGSIKLDAFPSRCTNPVGSVSCGKRADNGFRILPPIISARLRTYNKFKFRYGTVKVRAQVPSGDWIWPQIYLIPKASRYQVNPVEIVIANVRGNQEFYNPQTSERKINFGAKWLESGVVVGDFNPKSNPYMIAAVNTSVGGWDKSFHTYELTWTKDGLGYTVDGVKIGPGTVQPPENGFLPDTPTKMAPFDQEFFVVIGLGVGGVGHFPDGFVTKNGHTKPWKNTSPKAILKFWEDRDNWLSTWKEDKSALKIDWIKIESLQTKSQPQKNWLGRLSR